MSTPTPRDDRRGTQIHPRVVSMTALFTKPGGSYGWHVHACDELCLVADHPTTIGHAGKKISADPNTLFLFRHGERHGYWNAPAQSPCLWVIHFNAEPGDYAGIDRLTDRNAARRVWRLSPEQAETYRGLFLKVSLEHAGRRVDNALAESSWLKLLMIAAARWSDASTAAAAQQVVPKIADAELLALWQAIAGYQGEIAGLMRHVQSVVPNYDSLRHRFRRSFGLSPRQMFAQLRMDKARHMLMESNLSIKEIARAAGYGRQHEFTRAFRRHTGVSPTQWRASPTT